MPMKTETRKQILPLSNKEAETKKQHQAMKEFTVKQILALEDKTIYAREIHRSPSGQASWFDYYIVGTNRYDGKRELLRITWGVALLLDTQLDKKHCGIKVSGWNFDKAFEPIYNLFTFVLKMPDFQKNYRVERI